MSNEKSIYLCGMKNEIEILKQQLILKLRYAVESDQKDLAAQIAVELRKFI